MSIQDLLLPRPAASAPVESKAALAGLRSRLNAQELLTMLVGLRNRMRSTDAPRAHIRMSVYMPDGRPAVDVRLGPDRREPTRSVTRV
jgi:hypothetical protein